MELSDAAGDRAGNAGLPSPDTRAQGRAHLTRLLAPFGADAGAVAQDLIERFGSLAAVLAADPPARARCSPGHEPMLAHLSAIRAAMQHALHAQLVDGQSITTTGELASYLRLDMGFAPAEQVRVLFLGVGNRLIADEVLFRGTVDAAPLYARPIVHRALELGAAALILVHNHPSGEPEPSRGDVDATRELSRALAPLDILLHDHVIVARRGWTSLRRRGLM